MLLIKVNIFKVALLHWGDRTKRKREKMKYEEIQNFTTDQKLACVSRCRAGWYEERESLLRLDLKVCSVSHPIILKLGISV